MAKDLLVSDGSDSENGGVQLEDSTDFKVNEAFARKFTHNKKREEMQQCEFFSL
jgi:protein KRI1